VSPTSNESNVSGLTKNDNYLSEHTIMSWCNRTTLQTVEAKKTVIEHDVISTNKETSVAEINSNLGVWDNGQLAISDGESHDLLSLDNELEDLNVQDGNYLNTWDRRNDNTISLAKSPHSCITQSDTPTMYSKSTPNVGNVDTANSNIVHSQRETITMNSKLTPINVDDNTDSHKIATVEKIID